MENATKRLDTFGFLAYVVSPLCPLLYAIAYILTDDRYRSPLWFSFLAGVVPALIFSMILLMYRSLERRGCASTTLLLVSFVVWIGGTLLGMFLILVADGPNWFH